VGCNCMAGSKAKGICSNWIGIQSRYCSVCMKVGVTMMIVMLGGSGMYG
jgi:hypothetical protein